MNKKILVIITIIIVNIIAGVYFTLDSSDEIITIGHLPSDHDTAMYVAVAQKQYEIQGLKVKTVQFNNGGDLMTAMASGDVNVGYLGITPVLSSIEKGVPIKVVSSVQTEGSGVVVGFNSNINSLSDLKNKKIGIPGATTIQNLILTYGLNKSGVNINDVELVSMKAAQMTDALKADKIDAMICWEPFSSIAVKNKYGKLLENTSEIIPGHPCCVIAARQDFIDNHPKELKKILAIHENATKFINENPVEAANLLPEDIVPDRKLQSSVIEETEFVYGLDSNYKQKVFNFIQLCVNLGLLKKPINEDKIFAEV